MVEGGGALELTHLGSLSHSFCCRPWGVVVSEGAHRSWGIVVMGGHRCCLLVGHHLCVLRDVLVVALIACRGLRVII